MKVGAKIGRRGDDKNRNADQATNDESYRFYQHSGFWLEALKLLPQLGWLALVIFVIAWFGGPLLRSLDQQSISKVGVGIVQIEFAQQQLQAAAVSKNQEVPNALRDRIERTSAKIRGVTILWVDDTPQDNLAERRVLASLGVVVDIARSTDEAMKILEQADYTLVISDEFRRSDVKAPCTGANDQFQPASAGCDLVRRVKTLYDGRNRNYPPVIIYATMIDPDWGPPLYSFGATSRVDELFHLILDGVERRTQK